MSETATDQGAEAQPTTETVDDWKSEAEKWKQSAAEQERVAKENAGAAERLAKLEKDSEQQAAESADKLGAAEKEAQQLADEAKQQGEKTAEEWKSEAEKWKELSRKNEDLAKKNLAAAKRVEKLEADGKQVDEKTAQRVAELEAKTTEAEARALRHEVGTAMGVPTNLMQFLTGSSKKELEDQADRLLAAMDKHPPADESEESDKPAEQDERESELEAARKRAAEAEAKALRYEVAADKGVPPDLAEFLSATTREDLDKQADLLMSVTGRSGDEEPEVSTRSRMPRERLRSGELPSADPEPDPAELAKRIRRKSRGY